MGFCTLSTVWDGLPNINNIQLYIKKKKLLSPPFQMSRKKEKAFKTVKVCKVDSA